MQLAGLDLPEGMMAALQQAHAVPVRAYHHFGHVQEVLHHYQAVADGPGWRQPLEAGLAVLYHDAVYVPGRSDNERRSAVLAGAQLRHWLPDNGVDAGRVADLILLTAGHGGHVQGDFPADDFGDDSRHFLDCDMAILGAAPDDFQAYDRAIAEEYRDVVPAPVFRQRRQAFLQGLLGRERIFLSDFFHARLEARARANLARATQE